MSLGSSYLAAWGPAVQEKGHQEVQDAWDEVPPNALCPVLPAHPRPCAALSSVLRPYAQRPPNHYDPSSEPSRPYEAAEAGSAENDACRNTDVSGGPSWSSRWWLASSLLTLVPTTALTDPSSVRPVLSSSPSGPSDCPVLRASLCPSSVRPNYRPCAALSLRPVPRPYARTTDRAPLCPSVPSLVRTPERPYARTTVRPNDRPCAALSLRPVPRPYARTTDLSSLLTRSVPPSIRPTAQQPSERPYARTTDRALLCPSVPSLPRPYARTTDLSSLLTRSVPPSIRPTAQQPSVRTPNLRPVRPVLPPSLVRTPERPTVLTLVRAPLCPSVPRPYARTPERPTCPPSSPSVPRAAASPRRRRASCWGSSRARRRGGEEGVREGEGKRRKKEGKRRKKEGKRRKKEGKRRKKEGKRRKKEGRVEEGGAGGGARSAVPRPHLRPSHSPRRPGGGGRAFKTRTPWAGSQAEEGGLDPDRAGGEG
ncbi:hypothetical protein BXZ70DRAFT_1012711 [Cristinia sonorae]|uniref:Uncharacterized protein n=1 Tax=Cristinia sonorae TaxID=1940300 RepID=A0A8K0UF03_9AGAR|nr:hypothetical protein BXZ70DRAFT_1012711 [Cristinia sonorae]